MTEESGRSRAKLIMPAIAFLWTLTTVATMFLYSRSILGPTPVLLPIIFALVSFFGLDACFVAGIFRKGERSSLVISGILYFAALAWHVNAFMDIFYVS